MRVNNNNNNNNNNNVLGMIINHNQAVHEKSGISTVMHAIHTDMMRPPH